MTAVLIDPLSSNARARNFYEKRGFRFAGHRTFGEDHCAIYEISRADWEMKPF